jgi:hypothetical protein
MSNKTFLCPSCDREKPLTSLHESGDCFHCHASGVGVSWAGGGGYGRANWNRGTYGEAVREIHEGAAAIGHEIQSKTRWV